MVQHVEAIYENGVLRPLSPLQLADHALVFVQVSDEDLTAVDDLSLSEFDRQLDELASDDGFVPGTFSRTDIYSDHD
jgi:predicted DNA-binding antitoxin AbrB/MazE fold protein